MGANGQWGRENGTLAEGDGLPLEGGREMRKEMGGETGGAAQHKEEEEEEEQEEGAEENVPFNPFALPGEQRTQTDSDTSRVKFYQQKAHLAKASQEQSYIAVF